MRTLLLRDRVVVIESAGECRCLYDEQLGLGWTCDACLDTADVNAEARELPEL